MIEIVCLWVLCSRIGKLARKKGHTAIGYQFMTVVLWFGGEIAGGFMGVILASAGRNEPPLGIVVLCCLLGAAIGAVISFAIVNSLEPVRSGDEYYRPTEQDPYRPSKTDEWPGTEGDYRAGGDNPFRK